MYFKKYYYLCIFLFYQFLCISFSTGKSAYRIDGNEADMRQEIMTNGPIEAAFMVYEDFLTYKSGEREIKRVS